MLEILCCLIRREHVGLAGEYGTESGSRPLVQTLFWICASPYKNSVCRLVIALCLIVLVSRHSLHDGYIKVQLPILIELVDVSVREHPLVIVEVVHQMILEEYLRINLFGRFSKESLFGPSRGQTLAYLQSL